MYQLLLILFQEAIGTLRHIDVALVSVLAAFLELDSGVLTRWLPEAYDHSGWLLDGHTCIGQIAQDHIRLIEPLFQFEPYQQPAVIHEKVLRLFERLDLLSGHLNYDSIDLLY